MVGILAVGFAALDHVFGLAAMPQRPEKHVAHRFAAVGGGNAANAAVAMARLGGKVSFATRLGDDDIARSILAGLTREGIDCTLARLYPGHRSAISAILVDDQGERMVINYADETLPTACDHLAGAVTPAIKAVMADTRWEEAAIRCFAAIRRQEGFAVADIDRPPRDPAYLRAATHVALSAQALRSMTGIDHLPEALRILKPSVPGWLAVTDGERGVYYGDAETIVHSPAFSVKAVDTLGAGDVFHGALALALAEGMGEAKAVRFAAAAAALKCTRFGGRDGSPMRAELEAFVRGV